MPIPSPFFPRVDQHCISKFYKDWAGYYAVRSYDTTHDREYYAFRHACGLFDATPLYKYMISGKDAGAFLSRVTVKNVARMKTGQVTYLCWCDDAGKVVDDGTVTRLARDRFFLTAAEPSYAWFRRFTRGFDVEIEDITESLATLALQGPTSRALVNQVSGGAVEKLKFFRSTEARVDGMPVRITRTGYTGDLGYELWVENEHALKLWDVLEHHGRDYGMIPAGLDALDVVRVEAGFIMNGVDYHSAHHCLIEEDKSSPFELGLSRCVQLERAPFIGRDALRHEKDNPSQWVLTGLVTDWPDYERICAQYGLPPQVCTSAWRASVPLYNSAGIQIGYATSGAWSPTLKKNLALITIQREYATPGTEIRMEMTVNHTRHKCRATVCELPFFDPERKRS